MAVAAPGHPKRNDGREARRKATKMKARIQSEELVLLYGLSEATEKGQKVLQALGEIGAPYRHIPLGHLNQTLGFAAGMAGYEKQEPLYDGPAPEGEALIMKGFSQERLNALLSSLQKRQVGTIARKAVVTEHNRGWKLLDLFGELEREHVLMSAYDTLYKLVQVAKSLDAAAFEAASFEALTQAAKKAEEVMNLGEEMTLEALQEATAELRRAGSSLVELEQ